MRSIGIRSPLAHYRIHFLRFTTPDGSILVSDDDWRVTQKADIEVRRIAPTDDRESTIIGTLTANNYTAIVRGKNDGTG